MSIESAMHTPTDNQSLKKYVNTLRRERDALTQELVSATTAPTGKFTRTAELHAALTASIRIMERLLRKEDMVTA